MERKNSRRISGRMARCTRGTARVLALGGLLLTSGCVATSVSLDAPPPVTESRAKRDLGVDYLSSGRTAMAIRQLIASLDLDDSDPQTHLWLGEAYRRKGRADVAEKYLLDALALAKRRKDTQTMQEARLSLSAHLSQMGRYEESLEHCEVLAADPMVSTPWQPLTNCGWALMRLGRLDEARTRFTDALDFFPRYGRALLNLGILEAKEGHRLAAIEVLKQALDAR